MKREDATRIPGARPRGDPATPGRPGNPQAKKLTVNKRKYEPLDFSSMEAGRQPALDVDRLITMSAEALAVDVMNDLLSVVTLASFGAAAWDDVLANFNSDDVVDLRKVANDLHWPSIGRSLILNTTMDAQLLKDSAIKLATNVGTSD